MDKRLLFVANWKSNKTVRQSIDWLMTLSMNLNALENKRLVVCPSYTALFPCSKFIKDQNLPIFLGAQDVSPFDPGPYTGEVAASQLREIVDYVIIGHSERRNNFSETDTTVSSKTTLARASGLTSIVCVQNESTPIPLSSDIVSYEPVFAIGTGNADDPANVSRVFDSINMKSSKKLLLYGGSVSSKTIEQYLEIPMLSGFLVGGASLDPKEFLSMLSKC